MAMAFPRMRPSPVRWLAALLLTAGTGAAPTIAHVVSASYATFTTLGTGGGPIPHEKRAQPANLLLSGDQGVLVDVGDGATEQLGKIGVPMGKVQSIFISHLHFDHTGGLFAFLSRRFQTAIPGQVTVYGPPGTRATVDSMLAAMAPALAAWSNIRARNAISPVDTVKVVELNDGWTGTVGNITISAASNSHYALQPDAPGNSKLDTYVFRFDTPGRSITYTGDTGPSDNVERLAKGVDVLISEILDPAALVAELKRSRPDLSPAVLAVVEEHHRKEHLSPKEVGLMARRAGVKALVLTHNGIADDGLAAAKSAIAVNYDGPITFANDLQRF